MKQIKYTEEQLQVLKFIDVFFDVWQSKRVQNLYYTENKAQIIANEIKKRYGIKEKYPTLREYINKHSCGAYHDFIFSFYNGATKINVNVIGVDDFERCYNSKILDEYFVLGDSQKSYGCNCENYSCEHYLKIERKEGD